MSADSAIPVAFGRGSVSIRADRERADWTLIRPRFEAALPDGALAFRGAVRSPIGSAPLRDIVSPSDRVVLVTSDVTRPVPNQLLIPWLLEELPVSPEQVTVLVGTGTHRPSSPRELEAMFGADLVRRIRISNHDAFEAGRNQSVGTTASGTPVELDRAYLEADRRIAIGFIEPHFFAGFSGGPKAVAPGLASLETIFRLHSSRLIAHPMSTWGERESNPLHAEMRAAVDLSPADFLINVTLNSEKAITGFYCGDPETAHQRGCTDVRKSSMVPVAQAFDVVVTSNSGYPLDQNLYQTVKGISAAARIVKPGGTILVASECSDGLPDHGNFAELMRSGATPQDVFDTVLAREPILDQWQAQILAGLQQKARIAVFSRMPREQIEACKLEAIDDLQAALDERLDEIGPEARVAVLPDGPLTIPCLEGTGPVLPETGA